MFKDNPEGQTQYNLLSRDSIENMLATAFKRQFGTNLFVGKHLTESEVYFCNGFDAAIASKQEELDRLRSGLKNQSIITIDWRTSAEATLKMYQELTNRLQELATDAKSFQVKPHPMSEEADKNRELESWQRVAEVWRVNAVDWSRKNAELMAELAQAEEQIRKLKSELEDANAMNLVGTQQCIYTDVSNALKQANATIAALETKELELLGVIEQMRKAIYACVHCDYQGYYKGRHHIEQGQEALALTPDIAALKETFAPLAGSKTQHLTGSTD